MTPEHKARAEVAVYSEAKMKEIVRAAVAETRREVWEKAINIARHSVKKSMAAHLDVVTSEILIRRFEAARIEEEKDHA